MTNDGVECVRGQVLQLQVDRAPGYAQVLDNTLVPEIDEGFQRSALGHPLLEGDLLGVVQVDELEFIEAEAFEALLD
ncbi:hypothetical protein D9M72_443900 [compost metagenome]